MRSFLGRDILSLKDFEREDFFRIFEVAKKLEPIAKNRKNSNILADKIMVTAFYQVGATGINNVSFNADQIKIFPNPVVNMTPRWLVKSRISFNISPNVS